MIEFKTGIDIRARSANAPTVARFHVAPGDVRYCVIGTQYGYLHTTGGDVRTWRSYSGARRAITRYVPL
jgi:hypothetical protein